MPLRHTKTNQARSLNKLMENPLNSPELNLLFANLSGLYAAICILFILVRRTAEDMVIGDHMNFPIRSRAVVVIILLSDVVRVL